jgi:hypothetical protein
MKADDAKIDVVDKELQREDTMIWLKAPVFAPLGQLLVDAHLCGSCSDDRSSCNGLRSDLKKAEADLLDFEKHLAADRKQLVATSR